MKTILDVKRRLAAARCPYPVSLMDELEEAYAENERLRQIGLDALGCMITMSSADNEHVQRISEALREEEQS